MCGVGAKGQNIELLKNCIFILFQTDKQVLKKANMKSSGMAGVGRSTSRRYTCISRQFVPLRTLFLVH